MTIDEFEKIICAEGLQKIHFDGTIKQYVRGEVVYYDYEWKNEIDVFGVYIHEDGGYCIFITDSERGIPLYSDVFGDEADAVEALYRKITRLAKK